MPDNPGIPAGSDDSRVPDMPQRQSSSSQGLFFIRSTSMHAPSYLQDARPQQTTVLVENPKTLDEKGKLVSSVAVGVTSWKR
ncbi:Protein LOL4 [Zea mays]|uniref:Protein LOL4 n=1 Tax=Zea mays TaxID=4577 RepID=A0A3L6F4F0_MAIZE|nr:Protein LOL4 [Zea mays]